MDMEVVLRLIRRYCIGGHIRVVKLAMMIELNGKGGLI